MVTRASPSRVPTGRNKTRAKSADAKEGVRDAFIDAGRTLLATKGSKEYSLRAVAAAAGYSPGAIYKYFSDHRALLLAIREQDLLAATIEFERIAASEVNPERRVKALCIGAAKYWIENFEQFETMFSLAPSSDVIRDSAGVPFGRGAIAARSYDVFDKVIRDFLRAAESSAIDPKLAVDTLVAAVHGIVWFPNATKALAWSKAETMLSVLIDATLADWINVSRPRASLKR